MKYTPEQIQITNKFLEEIIPAGSNPEETLASVLIARGYLLENNGRLRLSDNSCLARGNSDRGCDSTYLNKMLKNYNLGYVDDLDIYVNEIIDKHSLSEMFIDHGGVEAFSWTYWGDWNYFKRREHGLKQSVGILEPYIARLVKALS